VAFRVLLRRRLVEAARAQADRGLQGRMEGHADMDMARYRRLDLVAAALAGGPHRHQPLLRHGLGVGVGRHHGGAAARRGPGRLGPEAFWQGLFLVDHPLLAKVWGPLVGPLVAVVSFVCSIGNVPLAAVLWNGGISFGGVVAFIFADLIVLPILDIYRRYYGWRMAGFLLASFYAAMVTAGLLVELLFGGLGLIPEQRAAKVVEASVTWNYTTILNLVFLALAGVLVVRFLRTGGPAMLKMMGGPPAQAGTDG
jgi:hypothetical protein